jgi:hypothetical protein
MIQDRIHQEESKKTSVRILLGLMRLIVSLVAYLDPLCLAYLGEYQNLSQ